MIRSMTGFASATGALPPYNWAWELRAVNGKGLDLRFRVPDWIEGLEVGLRRTLSSASTRGNVTCSLRLIREEAGGTVGVNAAQLSGVLDALAVIEAEAMEAGISLAPSRATDIAALRGVMEQTAAEDTDTGPLAEALFAQFENLVADFNTMRAREGGALHGVLVGQLAQVEALVTEAAAEAEARAHDMAVTLRRNLARVLDNSDGADPDRVAQELAVMAVKSDVTEEIDRLRAHIATARGLIDEGGPVGRKLDFLMQEFNREANTLCSKAQSSGLTRIGLALKVLIDQMREQVQNVE